MAEIKWIKITTDIFDDEKMLLIESMPEADSLIVIWFKLLTFAGKSNNNGVFMLSEKIPYTEEMLATIFRRPLNVVRLALTTFEQFGMIEYMDSVLTIPKWEKHQNIDGMDKIREQTRKRVAAHREKQKALMSSSECQYCGGIATGYDHILAISRGGADTEENKVPCCIECNRIKNDKPLVDFLNANRSRIRDDIVQHNPKLSSFVTLSNVTGCYTVTESNAIDKDKEEDKDKNKKKNKDIKTYSEDAELNQAILSFIDFRKGIKKPMTDRAVELLIGKLKKLSDSIPEQIEILNQSIVNGWTGLYPLKTESVNNGTNRNNGRDSENPKKQEYGVYL